MTNYVSARDFFLNKELWFFGSVWIFLGVGMIVASIVLLRKSIQSPSTKVTYRVFGKDWKKIFGLFLVIFGCLILFSKLNTMNTANNLTEAEIIKHYNTEVVRRTNTEGKRETTVTFYLKDEVSSNVFEKEIKTVMTSIEGDVIVLNKGGRQLKVDKFVAPDLYLKASNSLILG